MSDKGDGRYKIIRGKNLITGDGDDIRVPFRRYGRGNSCLTDKIAIKSVLPEKAKKLAIAFAELGEGLGNAFSDKVDAIVEKKDDDIYAHYGRILEAVKQNHAKIDGQLKDSYLAKAELLFRSMKNELQFAPVAYHVLREWVEIDAGAADNFISTIGRAKDNETLAGVCRNNKPAKG